MKKLLMAVAAVAAVLGAKAENVLPAGYTAVEYLESDGSQYIDTGVVPTKDTRVDLGYGYVGDYSSSLTMAGVKGGASNSTRFYPTSLHAAGYNQDRQVAGDTILTIPYSNDRIELVFNDINHKVWINGRLNGTFSSLANSYTHSLYLFALNNQGSASNKAAGRIWHCEIHEGDVTAHAFVPCVKTDGTTGLYDLLDANSETAFHASVGGNLSYPKPPEIALSRNGDGTVDVSFEAADSVRSLYFQLGNAVDAWDAEVLAASVPAGTAELKGLALPENVGTKYGIVRAAFIDDELPVGYRKLSYVASTKDGCQYVNTGIVPTADTCVEVTYALPNLSGQKNSAIVVGSRGPSNNNGRFLVVSVADKSKNEERFVYGSQQETFKNIEGFRTIVYNDASHRVIVSDGTTSSAYELTGTFNYSTSQNDICLFNVNGYNTHETYAAVAQIRSVKISQGSTVRRELVACLNAEGVAGFYDLAATAEASRFLTTGSTTALEPGDELRVTGASDPLYIKRPLSVSGLKWKDGVPVSASLAFGAAGRSRQLFVVYGVKDLGEDPKDWGNVVNLGLIEPGVGTCEIAIPAELGATLANQKFRFVLESGELPAGFFPVQSIDTTESGKAYFDTGIEPTADLETDIGYKVFGGKGDSAYQDLAILCGVRQIQNSESRYYVSAAKLSSTASSRGIRYTFGKWDKTINDSSLYGRRTDIVFNNPAGQVLMNGVEIVGSPISGASFQTGDRTVWLFAANSEHETSHWYSWASIYYCCFRQPDGLVAKFIPCVRTDGAPYFLDLKTGEMIPKSGTGDATGGEAGWATYANGLPVAAEVSDLQKRRCGLIIVFQ